MPTTPDILTFYPADAEVAGLYAVKSDNSEFGLPQGTIVACVASGWDPDKLRVCFKMDQKYTDPSCNLYIDEVQSLESTIVVRYDKKLGRYVAVESTEDGA